MHDAASAPRHSGHKIENDNLTRFERRLARARKSPRTQALYVKLVRVAWDEVGRDPSTWTLKDLEAFMDSDRWVHYAPSSRNTMRAALKRYWRTFGPQDLLGEAAWEFWETERDNRSEYEKKKAKTIPPAKAQAVLEHCRVTVLNSHRPHEVFRCFMVYTLAAHGLRCKGTANILVEDVHLDRQELYVRRSKGDKDRWIPLDPHVTEMWGRFMHARDTIIEELLRGEKHKQPNGTITYAPWDDDTTSRLEELRKADAPLFFIRTNTANRGRRGVGRVLKRATIKATVAAVATPVVGLKEDGRAWNPHAFRHARCFELFTRTQDYGLIADYMGHSSITTTHGYRATNTDQMRRAFEMDRSEGD